MAHQTFADFVAANNMALDSAQPIPLKALFAFISQDAQAALTAKLGADKAARYAELLPSLAGNGWQGAKNRASKPNSPVANISGAGDLSMGADPSRGMMSQHPLIDDIADGGPVDCVDNSWHQVLASKTAEQIVNDHAAEVTSDLENRMAAQHKAKPSAPRPGSSGSAPKPEERHEHRPTTTPSFTATRPRPM